MKVMSKRKPVIMACLCMAGICGNGMNMFGQDNGEKNLTELLKELGQKHGVKFTFSPTLTNKLYPKNQDLSQDIDTSLSGILSETDLSYKKVRRFYCIYVSKRDSAYQPPVVEIPEIVPEIVEERDSMMPMKFISLSTPSALSVSKCEVVYSKSEIEEYVAEEKEEQQEYPSFAIKTNLIYDASSTINLGVEIALAKKLTLDISGNYNPWDFGSGKSIKHWMVQPELRWWTKERFRGSFIGVHGHVGRFDGGGMFPWDFGTGKLLGLISKDAVINNTFKGSLKGGGITYGYSWRLGSHWAIEPSIGIGYAKVKVDDYYGIGSDVSRGSFNRNYYGITKAGLSIVYILK